MLSMASGAADCLEASRSPPPANGAPTRWRSHPDARYDMGKLFKPAGATDPGTVARHSWAFNSGSFSRVATVLKCLRRVAQVAVCGAAEHSRQPDATVSAHRCAIQEARAAVNARDDPESPMALVWSAMSSQGWRNRNITPMS